MQAGRGVVIGAVANDADQLTEAQGLTFGDETFHERAANALTMRVGMDVDRVFGGEPIGGPGSVRARVDIAKDLTASSCYEIRESVLRQRFPAFHHLDLVRRFQFVCCRAVEHGVPVDGCDRRKILAFRRPDDQFLTHAFKIG